MDSKAGGRDSMNKAELIEITAKKTNIPEVMTEQVINFAIDTLTEKLTAGEKVYIVGLGTFEVHKRKAHDAVNPQTGERINIGAYETPVFRPSEPFKQKIRNRNKK